MRGPKRFVSNISILTGLAKVTLGLSLGLVSSCALDDGRAPNDIVDPSVNDDTQASADGDDVTSAAVCTKGPIRCLAHVRTTRAGARLGMRAAAAAATPSGLGAQDLQSAYKIDPSRTATSKPTVAIIDAYGYSTLEADLAVYRSQYGLPPCTVASGCLKIVNQRGATTPLPSNPPAEDDWRVETALDIDMVSAACPLCNILVIQADDPQGTGLLIAQNTAADLGATVISDSWGGIEQSADIVAQLEAFFEHPGIAIFVAAGDDGFNDQLSTLGTGPSYPGTSAHVIAVGATRLVRDTTTARGWRETTWAPVPGNPAQGAGGSACSLVVDKPAYQTASPCAKKATTDIAAVGDPASGVAVYTSAAANMGGWITLGGTSASAPFVAAIFAATGNGNQSSGAFIAANTSKLYDVTSGTNGTCAGKTLLCTAAVGWDGPTGFGTPNATAFMPAATGSNGGGGGDGGDLSGGCSSGGAGAGGGSLVTLVLLGLRRRRAGGTT
jgi:subtilase family serine protease